MAKNEFDYDLFVIGGGSGGVRAARVAAGEHDAKVGLAEEDRYGGTCVIRGCVPKKLMVFASGYADVVDEAKCFGWDLKAGPFDWHDFKGRLNTELDRLEGVYRKLLKNSGVDTFDARARIKDPHTVALSDGTEKTAKHILIASGGRPVRPEIENAELGLVSDDLFHLEKLPKSILIIGGGYIACEFACILNGLGVEVTQYYRGAQILRGFDDEARGMVAEMMQEKGIDLHLGTNILEMTPSHEDGSGPMKVKPTNGTEKMFDQVLFATGRRPNSDDMGLEDLGVKLGRSGEIEVDEYSQTAVPSVYAIGDVTNRINLTPVAIREGMAFVETVFGGNPTPVDHDLVPSAIFTQPEMGTVGLSEEAAREAGPIEVYATSFKPMQGAFAGKADRVLMKLIVCAETRVVLGCHIVAPNAGELIQMVGIAVKMGATKEQFDATCAVHPTMSEELVTMRNPTRTA
ncbi:glutathione-disulfide reductase [Sulfitobacter sp. KE29]|jgi:glutathione reductase (NADPH)|uniref:glutathione-disulfide reductase n=1 Tax=Sulfitobacter TaxID=60136 RepID=UPI0007C3E3B0|nr:MULTISPECIES: glutathione-disulfide reductase [Sulfitobacter]KZY50962.1 NADPH-glutathione reductase [Sulfitobacter sp. HI0054]MBO9438788.1 glutathione-disulfide reductase [Sulfitobacter sp. R18_2]MDF3417996.1 glutathione-disulfide reductase [Sulfitobacter sp. Ks38]MDF3425478.1 glutathione-disulfide reductase [Sulfitobacter sp. KE29]MDF3429059.1 glutathione-disulfide reductase [Sulfitobacter sp. S46]